MNNFLKSVAKKTGESSGTAQLEQVVLIVAVAIGFAAAAVPLGALLLGYHRGIEIVLALPVP